MKRILRTLLPMGTDGTITIESSAKAKYLSLQAVPVNTESGAGAAIALFQEIDDEDVVYRVLQWLPTGELPTGQLRYIGTVAVAIGMDLHLYERVGVQPPAAEQADLDRQRRDRFLKERGLTITPGLR